VLSCKFYKIGLGKFSPWDLEIGGWIKNESKLVRHLWLFDNCLQRLSFRGEKKLFKTKNENFEISLMPK